MKTKLIVTKIFMAAVPVLLLAASGAGSVQAASLLSYNPDGTVVGFSLPGIRPAGLPNFENPVRLKHKQNKQKGFKLKVRKKGRESYFNVSPTESHLILGGNYKLDATFNTSGDFLEGSLKIRGRLETPVGMAKGTLMTANLTNFNFISDDSSSLLGFNTSNIVCDHVIVEWLGGCTTNESVYIALDEGGFGPTVKNFKADGLSVATVPVPAAVWLFGSGLIALAGVTLRRRKH